MLTITSQYTRAYQVLERFKKYVVQQSKSNLTKGGHNASSSLYGSIKGYINKRQSRNLAGKFTGGSSMPSLTFEMNSYGAFLDEGVKGSKAKSIYQKGIEKTSFFSKPFDKRFGTTMNMYHGAIADDIANNIANQLARKLRQKNKLKK